MCENDEPHVKVVAWEASDDDLIHHYHMSDGRSFSVSQNDLVDNFINETMELSNGR